MTVRLGWIFFTKACGCSSLSAAAALLANSAALVHSCFSSFVGNSSVSNQAVGVFLTFLVSFLNQPLFVSLFLVKGSFGDHPAPGIVMSAVMGL